MNIPTKIQTVLQEKLKASLVEIEDESHLHAGHKGRADSQGGHYNVVVVSPLFAGKPMLKQHRLIYDALSQEMGVSIHALSLKTYTPEQWSKLQAV
jgi:BolA family transcriptional regulator, general stress-responsive regulator